VTHAFTRAGIMVHAYLMYGFPTETAEETVETLERVRQFFDAGLIQSAYWHRFTATVHSPVGLDPAAYGIKILPAKPGTFAENDLSHVDSVGGDPSTIGRGLARAVYAYMHGVGLDRDVRTWFDGSYPAPDVSRTLIREAFAASDTVRRDRHPHEPARVVWLGGRVTMTQAGRSCRVTLPGRAETVSVILNPMVGEWLAAWLTAASPHGRQGASYPSWIELKSSYPGRRSFEAWTGGRVWACVRRAGLVIV